MRNANFTLRFISLSIALLLSIYKLPEWASYICPAWVPLLIIYWSLAMPHQVSIGTAWFLGILLDILNTTPLGEHALGLVIISYLTLKLHRQLRMFPVWQQALCILLLIALYQFLLFWIQGLLGQPTSNEFFWAPAITSALFWPILFYVLQSRK